ncbi:MAG: hypothetical protein KAJ37_11070 [Candidatus Krumholzibacteria bacterium]|nr:hypothetical protein [Candidatus Krumholzibacteria bacterium]
MSTRQRRREDVERQQTGQDSSVNQTAHPVRNTIASFQRHARELLDAARPLVDELVSDQPEIFLDDAVQETGQ